MPELQWNEEYSLQLTTIDEQHQQLFEAINRFDQAVVRGEEFAALARLLQFLLDYSRSHFAEEELRFDAYGYEEAHAHRTQHQAFIDIVLRYQQQLAAGGTVLPVQVSEFMQRWIREHVLSSDRRYAPLFREKGVR